MAYISFNKDELINLEYSLSRELLRSSRTGSFASTTIVGCNTRKYHGLLITRQPSLDNDFHVLLSSLDETIIQHDTSFHLGIHQYDNNLYDPKGHKYILDFQADPIPKITYSVGGVVFSKERLFSSDDDRFMIRFTLVDAHSPTKVRFSPLLVFRNVHQLSKENSSADTGYQVIPNGIKVCMYPGYSNLYMQFSKLPVFMHHPQWYYNISYEQEKLRGYHDREDLFNPGEFELSMRKGESIIFSAGLKPVNPKDLKTHYGKEMKSRIPRDSFINCLLNSAQQFLIKKPGLTELVAGFPWFGVHARDTFIASPGLMLTQQDHKSFLEVMDGMVDRMKGPFFPNYSGGHEFQYTSIDASLWFIWALQQYIIFGGKGSVIWKKYREKIRYILHEFRYGVHFGMKYNENGLLYINDSTIPLTWMDAIIDGKPLNPRSGYVVELNALWYNAVKFLLHLAQINKNGAFINEWQPVASLIENNYTNIFYDPVKGYLADFVTYSGKDWSVRPNQLIAASLPFVAIPDEVIKGIIDITEKELYTPKGIRTLSPVDSRYKGICIGNQYQRDMAYHQGSVFPWLLTHFAEAYLKIYAESGIDYLRSLLDSFSSEMKDHGIGSISEVFDGNPPHQARGGISHAWNVGELLRMDFMLKTMAIKPK